ncbi:hypothetical protein HMPREF1486_06177 [Streptomyces sp. HPH0547]|nr:hypothetical protein HMPREF1486_06177 [Streptomyces sp. HPH0547]
MIREGHSRPPGPVRAPGRGAPSAGRPARGPRLAGLAYVRGPWLARRAHVRDLRLTGRGHVGARGSWVRNHSLSARRPTPTGPWRSTSVGCPSWWLHGSGSVRGPYGGGSMRAAPRRRPRTDCPTVEHLRRRPMPAAARRWLRARGPSSAAHCSGFTPPPTPTAPRRRPHWRPYVGRPTPAAPHRRPHQRPHAGAHTGGSASAAPCRPPRTGGPAPHQRPHVGAHTGGLTPAALYRRLCASRPRRPPRAGRPAPAAPHRPPGPTPAVPRRRPQTADPGAVVRDGGPRRSRSRRRHRQAVRGGVRTP